MTEQILKEIEEILRKVEKTKDQLEKDRQCYTCALGHCDECGTYCEKAADDYDCEEEGCSNFKDGTPSYAKIADDDLQTILDVLPLLLAEVKRLTAERDAAVEDMTGMANMTEDAELCEFCKWYGEEECQYPGETSGTCFEWRGVKGE